MRLRTRYSLGGSGGVALFSIFYGIRVGGRRMRMVHAAAATHGTARSALLQQPTRVNQDSSACLFRLNRTITEPTTPPQLHLQQLGIAHKLKNSTLGRR